jgi:hypothetical protein
LVLGVALETELLDGTIHLSEVFAFITQ